MLVHTLALLVGILAPLSISSGSDPSELGRRIDAMIQPYVKIGDFSGTVLVAEKGEVLYERGFGYASIELGVESSPEHKYFIGSISKQFTAAALLLLEADEELSLSDSISLWLPGYPRGDEITIHHLLTHTAGIPDCFTLPDYAEIKHQDLTLEQVVDLIKELPLDYSPGTGYAYSNAGYNVAALIVETVSEQSYAKFLKQRIFEPLGMKRSGAMSDRRVIRGLAAGYDPVGRTDLRPAFQPSPALYTGSGSVYSTVGDLLRWDRALYTDAILTDSTRAKFMKNHGNGYGYGVSVFQRFGTTVIEHDGRLPGYAADLARYLDGEFVVIILGNIQSVVRDRFRDDIAALLHGRTPPERKLRSTEPFAQRARDLVRLQGSYEFGPNFVVHVQASDDHLLLRANQGEVSEFYPAGPNAFFSRTLYATCSFEPGAEDDSVSMLFDNGGNVFRGERRR